MQSSTLILNEQRASLSEEHLLCAAGGIATCMLHAFLLYREGMGQSDRSPGSLEYAHGRSCGTKSWL
ncbi:hypothetical protein ACP70R_014440 [Stipagrostis hirtigluma subsp. patula]